MSSLLDNTMDIALLPDRELDNIPKLEKNSYTPTICALFFPSIILLIQETASI
jgi:hypothetical protein